MDTFIIHKRKKEKKKVEFTIKRSTGGWRKPKSRKWKRKQCIKESVRFTNTHLKNEENFEKVFMSAANDDRYKNKEFLKKEKFQRLLNPFFIFFIFCPPFLWPLEHSITPRIFVWLRTPSSATIKPKYFFFAAPHKLVTKIGLFFTRGIHVFSPLYYTELLRNKFCFDRHRIFHCYHSFFLQIMVERKSYKFEH